MRTYSMIVYDLRIGLRHSKLLLISPVVCITLCFLCNSIIISGNDMGLVSGNGSLMDYAMYCFKGMEPLQIWKEEPFRIPIFWLLIMLGSSLTILSYPFENLSSHGQQVIVRCPGRYKWWLSKCIWNAACTLVYFIAGYLSILIFCIFNDVKISAQNTSEMVMLLFPEIMARNTEYLSSGIADALLAVVLAPVVCAVACNMFQMFIGLFIKPVLSFLIIVLFYLASSYYDFLWLFGSNAMVMRSGIFDEKGISVETGMWIGIGLITISVLAGAWTFKHFDILNPEE